MGQYEMQNADYRNQKAAARSVEWETVREFQASSAFVRLPSSPRFDATRWRDKSARQARGTLRYFPGILTNLDWFGLIMTFSIFLFFEFVDAKEKAKDHKEPATAEHFLVFDRQRGHDAVPV